MFILVKDTRDGAEQSPRLASCQVHVHKMQVEILLPQVLRHAHRDALPQVYVIERGECTLSSSLQGPNWAGKLITKLSTGIQQVQVSVHHSDAANNYLAPSFCGWMEHQVIPGQAIALNCKLGAHPGEIMLLHATPVDHLMPARSASRLRNTLTSFFG